jgi:hypothetical protein
MRRVLVVANRTLGGGQVLAKLRELATHEPIQIHVLVPAEPPHDHFYTEGEARRIARDRLDAALERFADVGLEATGEVGDEHPAEAINDVLIRGETFDTIVLSTLPAGVSRWLKLDLVARVRGFGIPVIHVVGHPEPAPRG